MMTENQKVNTEEISIKDLILQLRSWLHFIFSRWVIVLISVLLGAFVGLGYAFYNKPIYLATTTFVLEDEKGSNGIGSIAGLASMAGLDLGNGGGGIFQGDNILELYKSRSMIEKTLLTTVNFGEQKQLLIDRYIEFNNLRKNWIDKPELKNIEFKTYSSKHSRLQDSIIGGIVADINLNYLKVLKPDKKLSIIKADVKARDEVFAKTFNDEIVRNVNEFYLQTKTKKSVDNVKILQQKTDSVRAVMNGAIYNSVAIADATPNLNPTRQVQRLAPVQRSQFSAETNKAILGSLVQNLEMAKIALRKDAPLIQVIDRPVYPLVKTKFGKLKGLVIGGIFGGFIIVAFLSFRRLLKGIMA